MLNIKVHKTAAAIFSVRILPVLRMRGSTVAEPRIITHVKRVSLHT